MARTIIVYHTIRAGNTKKMADDVAEGVTSCGVEAVVKSVKDVTYDEVVAADGIAFGTPQPFSMLSGPLKTFFEDNWPEKDRITGKPAVCFIKSARDPNPGIEAIDKIMGYYGIKKVANTVGVTEVTDEVVDACRAQVGRWQRKSSNFKRCSG